LESRWDRTFFTTFGMGDRRPKACGPCVALASEQCQANPDRDFVYTRVPAEYRSMHLQRSAGQIFSMQRFASARGAQIFFFLPTSASATHDESARVWHAALSHRGGISVKCAPRHAHTPTVLGWRGSYLSCHPEGRVAQELMKAYEERLRTTDRLGAT
jgi:hypothetical protein